MLIDLGDETARPTDKTTGDDEEGDKDEGAASHIFTSGDTEKPSSQASDKIITAMRKEITMLRASYEKANHRALAQDKIVKDLILASERNESHLSRELKHRLKELQLMTEENQNEKTVHFVEIEQLETKIQRLKGENINLRDLVKQMRGHEQVMSLSQNQINQVQSQRSNESPLTSFTGDGRNITESPQTIKASDDFYATPGSISTIRTGIAEQEAKEGRVFHMVHQRQMIDDKEISLNNIGNTQEKSINSVLQRVQPRENQSTQHAHVNHTLHRSSSNLENRLTGQYHNLKKSNGQALHRRVRILQPKDFGLTQWKPQETDIATHLELVANCVKEARLDVGATNLR